MQTRRACRYGSIVLLCGGIMTVGLLFNGTIVSNYTAVIAADLGISRTTFSLYSTFRSLSAFGMNLMFYRMIRRASLKSLILIGLLSTTAVQTLLSLTSSVWMICVLGLLGGVAYALCGVVPLTLVLRSWFHRGYGTVLSLVMSASGLSGIVISPLLSRLIDRMGWRIGFRLLGGLGGLLLVLCVLFLHTTPGEIGLPAFGEQQAAPPEPLTDGAQRKAQCSLFGREQNSRNLQLLLTVSAAFALGALAIYTNISSVLQDIGFTVLFATGAAASCCSLANSVGKIFMGWVSDRFGVKRMLLLWYGLCPAAMAYFLFCRGTDTALALPGIFLIGFTAGIYSVPLPLACGRLFQDRGIYLTAVSLCTAASNLCTAFSSLICHGFFEQTGSYVGSLLFALALSLIDLAAVLCLLRQNRAAFRFDRNGATTAAASVSGQ